MQEETQGKMAGAVGQWGEQKRMVLAAKSMSQWRHRKELVSFERGNLSCPGDVFFQGAVKSGAIYNSPPCP